MELVELRSAAERKEALPILRELYPSLDEGRYAALLAEMIDDAYRQFAVRNAVGPYYWVRNPMSISAILVVVGEAWLFRSLPLLAYAGGWRSSSTCS